MISNLAPTYINLTPYKIKGILTKVTTYNIRNIIQAIANDDEL